MVDQSLVAMFAMFRSKYILKTADDYALQTISTLKILQVLTPNPRNKLNNIIECLISFVIEFPVLV